ncbi:unnamed protein product [Tuber aestivum]|uniref:Uncharacterized protein n=1 Tax=Tuber aestivum TaxID=59557 RepID=A0A292PNW2_9PEZI|nr:unnamed protein product [Tuber aestivum]
MSALSVYIAEYRLAEKQRAVEILRELAKLFCKTHDHEITPLGPAPGNEVRGYKMSIGCGEAGIGWQVEMWRDSSWKKIVRCKKVSHPVEPGSTRFHILLLPVGVWQGAVCDDILELHRSGRLEEEWWDYPIPLSENHKDAMYFHPPPQARLLLFIFLIVGEWKSDYYNEPATNDDPENEIRAIKAGYKGHGPTKVVYCPGSYSVASIMNARKHEADNRGWDEGSSEGEDESEDSEEGG